MVPRILAAFLFVAIVGATPAADPLPEKLAPFFRPPPELAKDLGSYRSPLLFADGTPVKTAADWEKRRQEIRKQWHDLMGPWPAILEKPTFEIRGKEQGDGFTLNRVRVQNAPDRTTD